MEISDLPDRRWIEKEYLPFLDGRVLYVGMDFYTVHYPRLAKQASLFQFLDLGENALRYGELGCIHEDFLDHDPSSRYRHISLYGLTGFGTEPERMQDLIVHANGLIEPGGTLMLGPNKLPAVVPPIPADAPSWVRPLAASSRSAEHWRTLFAEPPLDRYTVLVENDDLPEVQFNYIWWGRKPGV